MTTPSEWPERVTTKGHTVKIYRHQNKKGGKLYDEFKVADYGADGRRKFFTFSDYVKAKAKAKDLADSKGRGKVTVTLIGPEAERYNLAMRALVAVEMALDTAATEYAAARKQLGKDSLADAVAFYIKNQTGIIEKDLADVIMEFIRAKEQGADGKRAASAVYLKDIRSRLGRFEKSMNNYRISALGPAEIRAFLDGLNVTGRTWFNYARLLRTLFRFAQKQRYYPRTLDPFDGRDGIEIDYDDDSEIEIFTPEELSRLLIAARDELVPFVAIGAFAGLRHAEIARLDWSDVKADHIEIKKGKAKTRSRRTVPIQPNLAAWLKPHRKDFGKVVPFASMSKQLLWLAEDTGRKADKTHGTPELAPVDWKHNALRHSFISYRLAVSKDENAVALEAGNSPQMIFANYRALVTEDAAKAWFAIRPDAAPNATPTIAPAAPVD